MVKVLINSNKKVYTSNGKVLVSSGGSSGKYQLLQRISDDNNNEIGTVSGFFIDGNNIEYAVVCLDAQYRLYENYGIDWCSNRGSVTDLPMYSIDLFLLCSTETATFNTQKILDYCAANGYTSTACTHCRSKSFSIDGTTYYGQLPNMTELVDIYRRRIGINSLDTSSSSYPTTTIRTDVEIGSSNQYDKDNCWYLNHRYGISFSYKNITDLTIPFSFVIPVLEIPV